MKVSIIVAADENWGIGYQNQLLCHLSADLKFFKSKTMGHTILMGRKTHQSIGKALPGRTNIVLTKGELHAENCHVFHSIETGVVYAKVHKDQELFIIGGDTIYTQALHLADTIYLTRIHHVFEADAFFPKLNESEWQLVQSEKHLKDEKNAYDFSFETYQRLK